MFPLAWFERVATSAMAKLKLSLHDTELNMTRLKQQSTVEVWQRVQLALRATHQTAFSFAMVTRIWEVEGVASKAELMALACGPSQAIGLHAVAGKPDFLSARAWQEISWLGQQPRFSEKLTPLISDHGELRSLLSSRSADVKLRDFYRGFEYLLLMRCLDPENVPRYTALCLADTCGPAFANTPTLDIEELFA